MRINLAHLREKSTTGGWINFVVFEAKSTSGSNQDNDHVLRGLTAKARAAGLKVDKSALAFVRNGKVTFYGTKDLVEYLSKHGVPQWTHAIDA